MKKAGCRPELADLPAWLACPLSSFLSLSLEERPAMVNYTGVIRLEVKKE